jgi:hypothetical protein
MHGKRFDSTNQRHVLIVLRQSPDPLRPLSSQGSRPNASLSSVQHPLWKQWRKRGRATACWYQTAFKYFHHSLWPISICSPKKACQPGRLEKVQGCQHFHSACLAREAWYKIASSNDLTLKKTPVAQKAEDTARAVFVPRAGAKSSSLVRLVKMEHFQEYQLCTYEMLHTAAAVHPLPPSLFHSFVFPESGHHLGHHLEIYPS